MNEQVSIRSRLWKRGHLLLSLAALCIVFLGIARNENLDENPQETKLHTKLLARPEAGPAIPSAPGPAGIKWVRSSVRPIYDPPGRFYAYAPSAIIDGETERYWTCHNSRDGDIKDSIFYTERVNGKIVASKPVLTVGAPGAWDSVHVCDPAVIAGRFRLNGTRYKYALFYLGNDICEPFCHHNQIGVAFTNDLAGSWVKYPHPIVTHPLDKSWGAGQPSVTSLDGKGRLLLFYTRGALTDTRAMRRELDLSDMSRPLTGPPIAVTNAGLTNANGKPDFLNNFDIVYEPRRDRFYAVRDQHPHPPDHPSYIAGRLQVVSISGAQLHGGGHWRVEGEIGPQLTGRPRNHNAGIERTLRGTLPHSGSIRLVFTDGCAGSECRDRAEWSYDLWEIRGTLRDRKVKAPPGKPQ